MLKIVNMNKAKTVKYILINAVLAVSVLLFVSGCSKMFRGKDNTEPPAKLEKFKPLIKVIKVWERDIGVGTRKLTLRLKPVIHGKHVFAADYKGRVTALSLDNGKVVWKSDTKKRVSSGPVVNHKVAIVGTTDGEVIALDTKTGKQIWVAKATSEVLATPAISGDIVVIRSIDGQIIGLEIGTGKRLWIYGKPAPVLTIRGNSAPIVSYDKVYVGFDNGKIVSLRADKGSVNWEKTITLISGRTELERLVDIDSDPLIYEDSLYVSAYQGRLTSINTKTGQVQWNRKMSSVKSLAADANSIFVTDEKSHIWAIDRNTGAPLWKQDALTARLVTGPTVMGKYIVVGDFDGYLHWLSKKDGSFVARKRADGRGYLEAPVSYKNSIIILGRGGELAMFRIGKLSK